MVKKMKIALSILSGISYGGPTYFKNIIPALAAVDRINEYHIFIQKNSPVKNFVNQNNTLSILLSNLSLVL